MVKSLCNKQKKSTCMENNYSKTGIKKTSLSGTYYGVGKGVVGYVLIRQCLQFTFSQFLPAPLSKIVTAPHAAVEAASPLEAVELTP
jgi:hypothetical protein